MRQAVVEFLSAAGLPPDELNLSDTPSRVARVWAGEFLDGYQKSPEEILSRAVFPLPRKGASELVLVADLRFHSMCPHHLLPYEGWAHIAYAPSKAVVGFGRLAELLDCFAHRLTLQEELAQNVAAALTRVLRCEVSACIVETHQACLRLAEHAQTEARTCAEAYEGTLRRHGDLRRELWARLGSGRPEAQ